MRAKWAVLVLLTLLFSIHDVKGQDETKKKQKNYSSSTLFESKEPLSIEIHINKKKLFRDIGEDRKYHQAMIKYTTSENTLQEVSLKIQTRGNFRRNPDNCSMAPLRFKFPNESEENRHIFSGQKKLKLVLPCKMVGDKYQEYVILEYLVYQTYELFTEACFKTRLVNILLVDSQKSNNPLKFTGFFIEETDQMAERNNGEVKEFKKYHPEQVNREQMTMVNVFQYLIGNTDWSVEVGHNIKLLFIENQGIPYAIPYDFDWSGIISPPYAVPAPHLGLSHVAQRLYRGYLRKIEEYDPVIARFNAKKDEIYNLYQNTEYLSERTKNATIRYINEFYQIINNPKSVKREFIDNCRKPSK